MIPSKLKTFAAVAAAAFAVHAETVKENWTVTYDEKLTDDVVVNGTLTLDGASLDLNGHSLKVAGLTGDGVVTDSANEYYFLLKDNTRGFYIGLDYLASGTSVDGYNHGLEYIDTGYEHNVNTVVDMKVQILKTTTDCIGGTGITVGGEFKPVDGKCVTATLLDGSTLDVSGVAGTWNAYGAVVEGAGSGGALSFADDATINVKIGARVASARAPVVTFVDAGGEVAPPANYDTLKFVRGDAGRQYSVTKKTDGIYVASGLALIIL